jgi:hypothetical protein
MGQPCKQLAAVAANSHGFRRSIFSVLARRHTKAASLFVYRPSSLGRQMGGKDRLCGLVVRVPGYRSRGPGTIPSATDFLTSCGPGTGSTEPREYN